ncbi:hypothetical protein B0T16DRAFT_519126 [Cercophora newfieldiana]|uniref:Uncharacterized protein n=1 Tax=Cercophora newfieldiana TaxID=92897 RepID=A0AA39XTG3_9PEZI|nr:hypothetical protein B0T16DRAFT_519126 [Cercophora newfieldiana]
MDASKSPEIQEAEATVESSPTLKTTALEVPLLPSQVNQAITHGQFRVQELLREEAHCCVYSVTRYDAKGPESAQATDSKEPEPDHDLEARVYHLDKAIPTKLKRYRLRAIKRLESRAVESTCLEQGSLQLVVYRTGDIDRHEAEKLEERSLGDTKREDPHDPSAEQHEAVASSRPGSNGNHKVTKVAQNDKALKSNGTKPRNKSYRRRLSARVSQRGRRQAQRQKKRDAKSGDGLGGLNLWMPVLLYLAYEKDGRLREEVTKDGYETLRWALSEASAPYKGLGQQLLNYISNYLSTKTLRFANGDELERYIFVKDQEIVSLKRLQRMLPKIEEHYKTRFLAIMRAQMTYPKKSKQWEVIEGRKKTARQCLLVAQHAAMALPPVIERGRETKRKLLMKIRDIREGEAEVQRLSNLIKETESLDGYLANVISWCSIIVPLSTPLTELGEKFGQLEERLGTLIELQAVREAVQESLKPLLVEVK